MNAEKSKEEDVKIKEKLKEMQKHIPLLEEFIKSTKNGENNAIKHRKLKMMYEYITGKKPCAKLSILMRIEEAILKKKEMRQTRTTQEVNTSKCSKSSNENTSEIINLDSSDETDVEVLSDDDDDVTIVSYTAPDPKRISSGTKDNKLATSIVSVKLNSEYKELKCPIELEIEKSSGKSDLELVSNSERISNEQIKEEFILGTTNKVAVSDVDKSNEYVPDLNGQTDKREESSGITLKKQISSDPLNNKHYPKIKFNLKPKVFSTSVVRKKCDNINEKLQLPNNSNPAKSNKNILESAENLAEVSSTTPKVKKITSNILDRDKTSTISESKSAAETITASQKSITKLNETKETKGLSEFDINDLGDISSSEEKIGSSLEVSPNLRNNLNTTLDAPATNEDHGLKEAKQISPDKHSNILDNIDLPRNEIENELEKIQDFDFFSEADVYFANEVCSEAETSEIINAEENGTETFDKRTSTNKNEEIVSSSSEEWLTTVKVSKDDQKGSVEVSSSCDENVAQINERSLQTSPMSQNSLSPVLSPNFSTFSKEDLQSAQPVKEDEILLAGKEREDDKITSVINNETYASSQESGVLWLNDAETEEFIKKLDLEIGLENYSPEKSHDKQVLTQAAAKSSESKVSDRRVSQVKLATKPEAPRLRSEVIKVPTPKLRTVSKRRANSTNSFQKSESRISNRRPSEANSLDATRIKNVNIKKQVQDLKLAIPRTSKEGSNSPLQNRLINAGLLSDRQNSFKQTEPISCTATKLDIPKDKNDISQEIQIPIKPTSCAQPLPVARDIPKVSNISNEETDNTLKDKSIETGLLPEKTSNNNIEVTSTVQISPTKTNFESIEEESIPSLELSNPKTGFEKPSSPLKDTGIEEELSIGSIPTEHKTTLDCEILTKLSESLLNQFYFEAKKTISDTHDKCVFPCFASCKEDISNSVPVKDEQPMCESYQSGLSSTNALSLSIQPTAADSIVETEEQIEKLLFERRPAKQKSENQVFDSEINTNEPNQISFPANPQDVSRTSKLSQLDEWAEKGLDELHEIRFQLEKDLGVDLGIILYSGQNEYPSKTSKSQPIPTDIEMEDTMHEKDFAQRPLQLILPTFQNDYASVTSFVQPTSNVLQQRLGLPPELKSNDPRLRNRLALLYQKTNNPMLQQDSFQTKNYVPTAGELLGSQDQKVQNEIQSVCMRKSISQTSPTSSKQCHARTYGEYKRIKQAALKAEAAKKKAAIETANKTHQLELEAEKERQKILSAENVRLKTPELETEDVRKKNASKSHHMKTAKKERRKTLEEAHRKSVGETRDKDHHQLKLKTDRDRLKMLKVGKERRNTIQGEAEPIKIARKKTTVESTTRKTLKVRKERRRTIQTEVQATLKGEAAKKEIVAEAANTHLRLDLERQQTVKVGKERHKTTDLEDEAVGKNVVETECKEDQLTPKKDSQNTIEAEKGSPTITDFEDIVLIGTRKRRKPILKSSSEEEFEELTKTGSLEEIRKSDSEDIIKTRRKKKTSVLSSSSESENDTNTSPRESGTRKSIRKKRKFHKLSSRIVNCTSPEDKRKPENEAPSRFNELQKENIQKVLNNYISEIDLSDPNKVKEFAYKLVKPILKGECFEMFQHILEDSINQIKKTKTKSIALTAGTSFKRQISNRELAALQKDLNDSFIGNEVLQIRGPRRSSIRGEKRILELFNEENNIEDSQNCKSVAEKSTERNRSYLSDEDYETDSFEEHMTLKKKEEEIIKITKNPPIVLLKKLDPENLSKKIEEADLAETAITSKAQVDEHLLKPLKSVPFKFRAVRRQSQFDKTKSNTNPIWHYKDSFFSKCCILCSAEFPRLVDHYVVSHPYFEVYISRLTPDDVKYLENNPGRATRHLKKHHKYIAKCYFCGLVMKCRFDKLSHHYATHTGEFPYECSMCNFMSCNKTDVIKHTKNECKKDAQLQKYYTYDKNATKINLYVCTKCNYMQLHKANVVFHLRREHNCNEIHETDVKELILLEFVDDSQQNIMIVNEPVPSDPKSDDEEIIREIQHGETLGLPNIREKEDSDTDSVISGASIDVKPETLSVDFHIGQSTTITNIERNDNDSVKSEDSTRMKSETLSADLSLDQPTAKSADTISAISDVSTGLIPENPQSPTNTTYGDNVMTIIHNWQPKNDNASNENESEDKSDDVEQLLRDLTSTPTTTADCNESPTITNQHTTTEDLEPLVVAKIEPQREIEESNQKDTILEQSDKSNSPEQCQIQGKIEVKEEGNTISSFTTEEHRKSPDVEIKESGITVIEILEDEDEPQNDLSRTTTALRVPPYRANGDCTPSRVDNFGYQEIRNSEYILHCLIDKCNFGVTISFEVLKDHVKTEHNVKWSGKCNVCKDELADLPVRLPIEEELNHMLSVHLTELQDSENTNNHVINLLKPWLTETKSHKSKMLCEGMLSEAFLTSLYKCMGDDCNFTSDSKVEMSQHLATHELKTIGKADNDRSWLECCYCEHYADKTLHILEHIDRVHSTSIFQCSRCFYRSCSPVNVKNHQNQHHLSNVEKNTTLKCNGNVKTVTGDINRINKLREDNVKAISCSVCAQKYIRKDMMIEHFKEVHKESEIPKDCSICLFSCIFCNFENDKSNEMFSHMANKHPEEQLFIGVRGQTKQKNVLDDIPGIAYIGFSKTIEQTEVTSQPEDISSRADQAGTSQLSEKNDVIQKFKNNLMNLEDLKELINPCRTYKKNSENLSLEANDNTLNELKNKMMESLKYFITSEILHPCCICSKEINLENQWTDHFNTAHSTISRDAVWQCPLCPKKSSFWTYPVHSINHHNDHQKTYFCYYCGRHFYNHSAANEHLKSHSGEKTANCILFESSQESDGISNDKKKEIGIVLPATNNSSIVDVIKHMIEIAENRKEKESQPAYFIDLTTDLNENMCGKNYPVYIDKKKIYICSCNSIWIDEKAFGSHFKTAHKMMPTFNCPHCSMIINPCSYDAVRDHFKLHSKEIVYKCCLCHMYTSDSKMLIKHIKAYKRQSIPIVRFVRDDNSVKYHYEITHFSPISANRSSGNKIQCLFCPTRVDTYRNLDMHLCNVHKLSRTYQCYHCMFHGYEENVDSHIMKFHVKPYPKKFSFISSTVFRTLQNWKGNSSHLSNGQQSEPNNPSCSKVAVITQHISGKRKLNDISDSDMPANDQDSEKKKRSDIINLNSNDKSNNSDASVKACPLCFFKYINHEDYIGHIKSVHTTNFNSSISSIVGTSINSDHNHTITTATISKTSSLNTATIPTTISEASSLNNFRATTSEASSSNNLTATTISETRSLNTATNTILQASSSNQTRTAPSSILAEKLQQYLEPPEKMLRLVPLSKLLKPISTYQETVPQPSTTSQALEKRKKPQQAVDQFTYICFHCSAAFKNYIELREHWMSFVCPANENVSYKFRIEHSEDSIARHVLDKICKTAQFTKSVCYQCSECSQIFLNKNFCLNHMASKLLEPLFFTYEHNVPLYGCDECNAFYWKEENAIEHIARHTFRFSCLFCRYAYRTRDELYLHYIHTHQTNERRYKYDVRSTENMYIYQQMLVVFPCGLVLTKNHLRHTSWGNCKAFCKLIDMLIKDDTYN